MLLYKSDKLIELGDKGVFGQELEGVISDANLEILRNEIELVDGAGNEFDKEAIDEGKAYLKYQGKQNASWDEYTKEFNIVSHDQKQEDVDEDALALLQQYD